MNMNKVLLIVSSLNLIATISLFFHIESVGVDEVYKWDESTLHDDPYESSIIYWYESAE